MEKLVSAIAFSFVLVGAAFSETPEENVRTLLRMSGADKLAVQMLDLMIPELQKIAPEAPPEFWQKFRDKVDAETLIMLLVPVYTRYYTDADVLELIAFYETPIGQKLIRVLPSITQESYVVGQTWGRQIAEEILAELRRAGYQTL